jgi:hypothetical protein
MFSVSFCVMFYCFFKERTWRFYGRRRVGNDFGFTELVSRLCIRSEEIWNQTPPRKPRKSSASADTDPDEPEQKMDSRSAATQHSTTNQQLTRWRFLPETQ